MIKRTKAETLDFLLNLPLRSATVLPLEIITLEEWKSGEAKCLDKISSRFDNQRFVVRSSHSDEDASSGSRAGQYLSLLDIPFVELRNAIGEVFESYGTSEDPNQHIFIQPMLSEVILSGVGFSHDPNTSACYRVINWYSGAQTDAITGGLSGETWYCAHGYEADCPPELAELPDLIAELVDCFDDEPIDFEFAIRETNGKRQLFLFQVRPLVMFDSIEPKEDLIERLDLIKTALDEKFKPKPFEMGGTTIFGVMPDWNPAEIIGIRPKKLSLSLYKNLITNNTWAYQRSNYGYSNMRGCPLLVDLWGSPYIDTRRSFNSFVPADVPKDLAQRLVDHYLLSLSRQPALHDKVEFEIVLSCYPLDFMQRAKRLEGAGFSSTDIQTLRTSLSKLTNSLIDFRSGVLSQDLERLETLERRFDAVKNSEMGNLDRVYWLLEDCRRYGTLPFAGFARAGFVAVQLLDSLVTVGLLSENRRVEFFSSISTVSKQFIIDQKCMSKSTFLRKYGHLRPGTYSIEESRYDENPDLYLSDKLGCDQRSNATSVVFELTEPENIAITARLKKEGFEVDAKQLFEFIKFGIEQREWSKFLFCRNVSEALKILEQIGSSFGFNRYDLAFCDIEVFIQSFFSIRNFGINLKNSIEMGMKEYKESCSLNLPSLIMRSDDIYSYTLSSTTPNFITQKSVRAPVVKHDDLHSSDLSGAIALIPRADPGFDWIFSQGIAGLVTEWGGVNSHMAIRAGELGIPAVIGAGPRRFSRWLSAEFLSIDCANKKVIMN